MAIRTEFHEYGGPEVFQTVEFTPADPTENEVQAKNKAIGINFVDIYIRSDLYPPPSLPSGLGTEMVDVVSKVGSSVKHIKAGDRVVYARPALSACSSMHNINADKMAILPAAISFEQAAAPSLKGLAVYYLLRKTYEIKPDEQPLFHATTDGVGLIAYQWVRALGAKLIGTVGTAQKAQSALKVGVWQVISYREENLAERLEEIAGNRKVCVVYDSAGRGTWERSLGCLQHHGLVVGFSNSSGAVTGINLGILGQEGSSYVTRPSLQGYITMWEELAEASNELFSLIASGVIKADVTEQQKYPLRDTRHAHEILESWATQGSSLLIP